MKLLNLINFIVFSIRLNNLKKMDKSHGRIDKIYMYLFSRLLVAYETEDFFEKATTTKSNIRLHVNVINIVMAFMTIYMILS